MPLQSWKENKFWKFYPKWLLRQPATVFRSSNLWYWRQHFLLFYETRFECQTNISCKFLFWSVQWTWVLTGNSCFQCFLQALFGNNLIYTTPSGQIIPCHVFFLFIASRHLVFDQPKHQEFYFNSLQSRLNVGVKSVGTKVDIWEKCTLILPQGGLSI